MDKTAMPQPHFYVMWVRGQGGLRVFSLLVFQSRVSFLRQPSGSNSIRCYRTTYTFASHLSTCLNASLFPHDTVSIHLSGCYSHSYWIYSLALPLSERFNCLVISTCSYITRLNLTLKLWHTHTHTHILRCMRCMIW